MSRPRCGGRTVEGRPCRQLAGRDSPYCFFHDYPRWTPVEFIGGPLDGRAAPLRDTGGWRHAYAVLDLARPLVVLTPGAYNARVQLADDLEIRGRYDLRYLGLRPAWRWARLTSPEAATDCRPDESQAREPHR